MHVEARGFGYTGTGVTGGCKSSSMGAGNRT